MWFNYNICKGTSIHPIVWWLTTISRVPNIKVFESVVVTSHSTLFKPSVVHACVVWNEVDHNAHAWKYINEFVYTV